MIESNDPLKLKQEVQARGRRRKSAKWKSGLMITGLGAVVAGAGYLAGVNAPAINQSTASQTVARSGTLGNNSSNLNQGQGFQLNGDDGQGALNDGGSFQFNGDDGSGNPFGQQFGDNGTSGSGTNQFNQQFGGRRNRQFRGSGQQQPNFGGPVTRSRGS